MIRSLQLIGLLMQEHFSRPAVMRQPEPELMDECISDFHTQGQPGGVMFPVYHFNALAVSRLIPRGGSLLDLGSGSGQFLAHLARVRPDVNITGLDLSPEMVEFGNRFLRQAGLSERVELRRGDMTDFRAALLRRPDLVSCIFALHHLPGEQEVRRCLAEIAALRRESGCGVWIFDHVRPRKQRTAEQFPTIFCASAGESFRIASRNSLLAAYSFADLSSLSDQAGMGRLEHHLCHILPLYQTHWLQGAGLVPASPPLNASIPMSRSDSFSAWLLGRLNRSIA